MEGGTTAAITEEVWGVVNEYSSWTPHAHARDRSFGHLPFDEASKDLSAIRKSKACGKDWRS
jgi:hypothetical protein